MKGLPDSNTISEINLGDKRLNSRLDKICVQINEHIGLCTSSSITDRHQLKGYYRFINNDKVCPKKLIQGYGAYSQTSISDHKIILAIQDSTTLHYTGKRSAANLDCIETIDQKGFVLHNHLLMNDLGCPFGLFSQLFYSRKASELGKKKSNARKKTPFTEKESYRWLSEFNALQEAYKEQVDKTVIQICDREADIHEVLESRKYEHIHYIIRSSYERNSADVEQSIWEEVGNAPMAYRYIFDLPASNNRQSRAATMEVRYKQVTINPSYRKDYTLQAQALWIVETKEVGTVPQGEEPIHWRLLTSIPILTTEIAAKIIQYYIFRWIIERFHYVLKQGLKVQELQVETKSALQNAIILKSWVAIDVMILQYLPQTQPTLTLESAGFSLNDYQIAFEYAKKFCNTKEKQQNEPLLIHFTRLIAQIGGHSLQVKKPIGVVSIWRGWNLFCTVKKTYEMLLNLGESNIGKTAMTKGKRYG